MSRSRASLGVLPDDLYIEPEPWPRIGRPPKQDVEAWTVTDDWPDAVPITDAELDVFEAWFGNLFDELFGAGFRPRCSLTFAPRTVARMLWPSDSSTSRESSAGRTPKRDTARKGSA